MEKMKGPWWVRRWENKKARLSKDNQLDLTSKAQKLG